MVWKGSKYRAIPDDEGNTEKKDLTRRAGARRGGSFFSVLPEEEGIARRNPLPGNEIPNEIMITSSVRRMRNP